MNAKIFENVFQNPVSICKNPGKIFQREYWIPRGTPFIENATKNCRSFIVFTRCLSCNRSSCEFIPRETKIERKTLMSTPQHIFVWHMRPLGKDRFCSIEQPPSFFTRTSREQLLCADSEPFPSSSLPYYNQVLLMYYCLRVWYFQLIWNEVYLVWT